MTLRELKRKSLHRDVFMGIVIGATFALFVGTSIGERFLAFFAMSIATGVLLVGTNPVFDIKGKKKHEDTDNGQEAVGVRGRAV